MSEKNQNNWNLSRQRLRGLKGRRVIGGRGREREKRSLRRTEKLEGYGESPQQCWTPKGADDKSNDIGGYILE